MVSDSHLRPTENRKYVIAVAFLASALGAVDAVMIALALPQIREALDASFIEAQWFSNAYLLLLSTFLLLGGGLADKFGIKRVFASGITLFVATSALCALAWSPVSLTIFRALQGVGAAIMLPGGMVLIARHIPNQGHAPAMGTWVGLSAIAAAALPFLGSYLLTYGGPDAWRMIFMLNLPFGLLGLFILWRKVPLDEATQHKSLWTLDWPGAALLTLAMAALATGLTLLGAAENQHVGLGILVVGVVLTAIAIRWELKATNAMIDMRLFRLSQFAAANAITSIVWGCMGGITFFFPMTLMIAWNLPATYAGFLFIPFSLMIAVFSPVAGRWVERHGTRPPLVTGSLIFSLACLAMVWAIGRQDYWFGLLPGFAMLGSGVGLVTSTILTAVVNAVPAGKTGAASGINNMMARISFLFAVAGFSAFISHIYGRLITKSSLDPQIQGLMQEAGFGERLTGGLYQIATIELQASAMNQSLIALCLVLSSLAFLSALISYFTQPTAKT